MAEFKTIGRRQALGLILSVGAASLAAACAPGVPPAAAPTAAAPTAAPATTGKLETIQVGASSIIASAALFVGMDRGYFKDQGLDIQKTEIQSQQDSLPSIATGKMDVGNGTVDAFLLNAVNNGVDIRMVAGQASYTPKHGTLALVIRKALYDAGTLKTLADMKGRKIAVPVVAAS